ncbi:uncharacterized protein [Miscanthus floridulus]|uniref:uncharacterized protein n=1 Tax=Miscanthus floridulus TaxID=154761 RepID=UPI00345964DF
MYKRPGNPWDLKNYRQKVGQTLRGYIQCFSRQCNELPNVANINVIGSFLSRTTCESLVHKLGRKGPRTTKELLDITTSHASGEEVVKAIFDCSNSKARWEEGADEGTSNHSAKRKNKNQRREDPLVAAADRKGGRKPMEGTPNHFKKMLEGPCPNHAFPVKHLFKDYGLMRKFLVRSANKGEREKEPTPAADDTEEKDDDFPTPDGYLMIFEGSMAYDSKRCQKVARRQVYMAQPATPLFLRGLEAAITFDWTDHPNAIPHPGRYPLVVDPIVGPKCLTKVLMDGGNGLNIMYAKTLDVMGVDRTHLRPAREPFHGIIPGKQATPLGQIDLPVTFGDQSNYRTETLTFDVVGFPRTFHAILGRPCYTKFMTVPNYMYLKLKMLGPHGVITIGTSF